jgi:TonB-linked SusC/RagA family outer membrane protein
MKKYIFILLSLLSITMYAQKSTLTGKVISAKDNQPLIGATVMVKGSGNGTITDYGGKYSLKNITQGDIIIFSIIGYKTKEIALNNLPILNVSLDEEIEGLNEVVVIGYGTAKKSDLTSSITSVKGSQVSSSTGGNALLALQGQANGVQITNSGGPGFTPRVLIRGITTVNGSDPIYIVDGMQTGTNINFLNPNDIESIEVLKDASAAAIYGTRGSNGVVLITTKKGSPGKTKFQVDVSVGLQTIKDPKMAKAAEYEKVFKARYTNDGYTDIPWVGNDNVTDTDGTNWWKETVRSAALIQNYNIGFQGGNQKYTYSGSVGYFRQASQYHVGYWDRISSRFNSEYKFNKIVKAGINFNPRMERWDDTPSLFNAAMQMDPTTPVYLPQEEWTDNPLSNYARSHNNQAWNPVAQTARQNNHSNEYGLMMIPYLDIEPIKGLNIHTQFSINAYFGITDSFSPKFFIDNLEKTDQSSVSRVTNTNINWNWNNTINYIKTFDQKHNLNVMAGYTMERYSHYWLSGARDNTPSNISELQYVSAGTLNQKASGSNDYVTLLSYLGRVMYNYDNRYYLTASIRVDGSSKFPKGNKYATFPAISGAWRISSEPFMKDQNIFSNLKLRAGWGRVGNQNIDSNSYITLIGTTDYTFGGSRVLGTSVSNVGNTKLKWETVEDYDLGLDMSFLNGHLNVTIDAYQRKSHDMLLQKENLLVLGYPMWNGMMWTNIGSMKATGWEFSVNYNGKANDFNYEVGLNLSSVKNKAIKLLGGDSPIYTNSFYGDYATKNVEGGEVSRFYGYVADGIFQNMTEINSHTSQYGDPLQKNAMPGDIRFKDLNHDGVINEKDKTWIGNGFPNLMIGLNSHLTYKNFDLIANFYGTIGNDIFNTTKWFYSGRGGANVFAGTYNKAWHGEGTSNSIPRLSVNDPNNNYKTVSSFFIEDGSYFRCKLLQLGYTIPQTITKIIGIRFYISAQNLFTITKYSGMDPERAAMGGATGSGVDNIGYPNPRIFLLGTNITF